MSLDLILVTYINDTVSHRDIPKRLTRKSFNSKISWISFKSDPKFAEPIDSGQSIAENGPAGVAITFLIQHKRQIGSGYFASPAFAILRYFCLPLQTSQPHAHQFQIAQNE